VGVLNQVIQILAGPDAHALRQRANFLEFGCGFFALLAISTLRMNELLASNDDPLAILHGAIVRDLDQQWDADDF
jgi:hypothetical protein